MIKYLFIIVILQFLNSSNALAQFGNDNLEKVELSYVDANILTPFSIPYNLFGNYYFKNIIQKKIILDKKKIDELYSLVLSVKKENKRVNVLNVRYKIVFYTRRDVFLIVYGGNTIFLQGQTYRINKAFYKYMKNLRNNND